MHAGCVGSRAANNSCMVSRVGEAYRSLYDIKHFKGNNFQPPSDQLDENDANIEKFSSGFNFLVWSIQGTRMRFKLEV